MVIYLRSGFPDRLDTANRAGVRPVPEASRIPVKGAGRTGGPTPLFGLAPRGVYHAPMITHRAVGFYPAFSPLPRSCDRGGLFSVTLSIQRSLSHAAPQLFCGTLPSGVRTFLSQLAPRATIHPPPYLPQIDNQRNQRNSIPHAPIPCRPHAPQQSRPRPRAKPPARYHA